MDSDALLWWFLTNTSPAANAPSRAASPAATGAMTAMSRSATARSSKMPAVARTSRATRACAVSTPGAVSISRRYEIRAPAAGTAM